MGMIINHAIITASNLSTVGKLKLDMDMLIKYFKENPEVLNEINSTFRKEKLDKIKDRINAKSDL